MTVRVFADFHAGRQVVYEKTYTGSPDCTSWSSENIPYKSDLNPGNAAIIENEAKSNDAFVLGRIPYDTTVTEAMVRGQSVIDFRQSPASAAIDSISQNLLGRLRKMETVARS